MGTVEVGSKCLVFETLVSGNFRLHFMTSYLVLALKIAHSSGTSCTPPQPQRDTTRLGV